jgi:hypothetical protein
VAPLYVRFLLIIVHLLCEVLYIDFYMLVVSDGVLKVQVNMYCTVDGDK